ncbi:MAG: hypothetical protein ACJ07L_03375 [Opitutales bacterium]
MLQVFLGDLKKSIVDWNTESLFEKWAISIVWICPANRKPALTIGSVIVSISRNAASKRLARLWP